MTSPRQQEIMLRLADAEAAYQNGMGGIAGSWARFYRLDVADLRAALVEAEQQRDNYQRNADSLAGACLSWEAENAQLREALEKFGTHRLGCAATPHVTAGFHLEERDGELETVDDSVTVRGECTCGLQAVRETLSELAAPQNGETA